MEENLRCWQGTKLPQRQATKLLQLRNKDIVRCTVHLFHQQESWSALCVRISWTHLLYIHGVTLQQTEKESHRSWTAQTQQILCILGVSHLLNVWCSYAVYQEYVQYICCWINIQEFPWPCFYLEFLLDMERRWIQRNPNATINAGLYYQLPISVCMAPAQLVSIHVQKE